VWPKTVTPQKSDAHDEQERAEIRVILSELPEDHPAWAAHAAGADAIKLIHIVGRNELVEKLTQAWLDGYGRMLRRQAHFRPLMRRPAANDPQGRNEARFALTRRMLLWLIIASGITLLGFIG
jgi:hypothetical protein